MGRPEDSRVKIPALVHFTRLGYTYMSIKNKKRGVDYDPDTNILLDLKKALEDYKTLHNLIRLFGYDDLYEHFDIDKSIQLLNEVNNRINIVNFKQNVQSSEDMSGVLNLALDQIDFQFRKISEEEEICVSYGLL